MSFGKHKGITFSNVPASYWMWLEQQDWFEKDHQAAFAYFQHNLRAIEMEHNENREMMPSKEDTY